jgi:hypothetical protein
LNVERLIDCGIVNPIIAPTASGVVISKASAELLKKKPAGRPAPVGLTVGTGTLHTVTGEL